MSSNLIAETTSQLKWRKAWEEHKALILFVSAYSMLGVGLILYSKPELVADYLSEFVSYMVNSIWFVAASLAFFALIHLFKERPKTSPARSIYKALRQGPLANENLLPYLFAYVSLMVLITTFVELKVLIPTVRPFAFDPAFERLDRIIHFGQQPWELVQHILGHPWITLTIHRLYYLWFPIIFLTYYWQLSARKDPVLRQQFILSFIACWALLGSVLATLLSSVGPIYYADIVAGGEDVYAKPLDYLLSIHEQSPMITFHIKEALWANYTGEITNSALGGISAMPSMHVSIAFLLVLFGWRQGNKWLAYTYTAFFVAILLGSVHLLWHYAVDGYVSIIATLIIWKVSGAIAKRSVARAEQFA